MSVWKQRLIWWSVLIIALSLFGCASNQTGSGHGGDWTPPLPKSLIAIDRTMAGLALAGTLAIVGGAVIFFTFPAGHKLSSTIAIAGASLLGVSLFVKISLPWLPWIAAGLVLAGIGWSVWRHVRHKSILPSI